MVGEYETASKLSNATRLNDLEWPLTQISRSRYYSTSNNSKTVQDRAIHLQWPTNLESRIWSIGRRDFQWTWMTPTPGSKVTLFFDAEYLRNGTRYRHGFNRLLIGTYTRPTQLCRSNDLEWLSRIFNDTKRRAVSLRQLSFLSSYSAKWLTRQRNEVMNREHFWSDPADIRDRTGLIRKSGFESWITSGLR